MSPLSCEKVDFNVQDDYSLNVYDIFYDNALAYHGIYISRFFNFRMKVLKIWCELLLFTYEGPQTFLITRGSEIRGFPSERNAILLQRVQISIYAVTKLVYVLLSLK